MPRPDGRRFLTTVFFLDLVGSTATASQLGDAQWRNLLRRFRQVVRIELRRHAGHEEDTTGDGFLATFAQPADAVRAAAAIVAAVHQLGLDVRVGIHTGECERVDRDLAGVAVHIGARVMALAGAAEIVTTRTVRDLVHGSGVGFEERGEHQLKGIDGSWSLVAVRSLDGTPLPTPLETETAGERQRETASAGGSLRGRRVAVAAVVVVALVAAGLATFLLVRSGGAGNTHAALGHRIAPTLIRIDPSTAAIKATAPGAVRGSRISYELDVVDGTLWQLTGNEIHRYMVARDLQTGVVEHVLEIPQTSVEITVGFGSVWVLESVTVMSGPNSGETYGRVLRYDAVSGRRTGSIRISGVVQSGAIAAGNGAVSVLEVDGTLDRIDPLTNRITGRYKTGAIETSTLVPLAGFDWICECIVNKVLRFDPATLKAKTFPIAESAYLIGVSGSRTAWLLDNTNSTLTSIDPRTGKTGQPLGLAGTPATAVVANGSVWVAAGHVVDRLNLELNVRTTIPMPAGFYATQIAADESSHTLWVGRSPPQ